MFKMASQSMNTSPAEMSSSFVSCLIDNCLLYARPDHTQTQLQLVFTSTRRNIHPLTPILIINHPLSAFSINYGPQHPPCSIYVPDSLLHNISPSPVWSTSWYGPIHFILHTFLHPIILFFSQHMPIPTKSFQVIQDNLGKHERHSNMLQKLPGGVKVICCCL